MVTAEATIRVYIVQAHEACDRVTEEKDERIQEDDAIEDVKGREEAVRERTSYAQCRRSRSVPRQVADAENSTATHDQREDKCSRSERPAGKFWETIAEQSEEGSEANIEAVEEEQEGDVIIIPLLELVDVGAEQFGGGPSESAEAKEAIADVSEVSNQGNLLHAL